MRLTRRVLAIGIGLSATATLIYLAVDGSSEALTALVGELGMVIAFYFTKDD